MAVRVGMVSLGCSKNQVDAERMLYKIQKAGYQLIEDAALADIAIINTCGFIESAKQEAIETIFEFVALKNEGRIKKIVVPRSPPRRLPPLPQCGRRWHGP